MTKPREKTREEVTAEIEESKKKIRQFENREKIIKQKLSVEERKARNHRLCKRGGFLVGHGLGFRHNTLKDRAPDDQPVAARPAFLLGQLLPQHLFPVFKLPDFLFPVLNLGGHFLAGFLSRFRHGWSLLSARRHGKRAAILQ